MGLRTVIICWGTNFGQKRTATTTARDRSSTAHKKAARTRRPFFFLRLGLKTGSSLSGITSFESPVFFGLLLGLLLTAGTAGSEALSIALGWASSAASGGGGSITYSPGRCWVLLFD